MDAIKTQQRLGMVAAAAGGQLSAGGPGRAAAPVAPRLLQRRMAAVAPAATVKRKGAKAVIATLLVKIFLQCGAICGW